MTIASFLSQHRRTLLLCAATLALHGLLLRWVVTGSGPAPAELPAKAVVSMRLSPPSVPPLAALSKPAPVRPPPVSRPPVRRPPASPEPASSATVMPPAPADAVAEVAAVSAVAPIVPAPETLAPVPEAAPDVKPDLARDLASDVAPPQRYRVRLPPSADLVLDVLRVDADGTRWNGVGAMSWRQDGSHYSMTVEAGLSVLVTRVNLLVITSEGQIDDNGIAPLTATEKRKGRSLTATHFNRDQGRITFSASELSYPLLPGAQDKATLPFQLAGMARADINQLQGNIDLFVGEDREANVFRFNLVGEEELETKMGRLLTWHLSRPPKPGTYSSRLDIWLAPGSGWYPVQIRNTEGNGAVTTQSVTHITAIDSPGT
jgi:hypothetical protein